MKVLKFDKIKKEKMSQDPYYEEEIRLNLLYLTKNSKLIRKMIGSDESSRKAIIMLFIAENFLQNHLFDGYYSIYKRIVKNTIDKLDTHFSNMSDENVTEIINLEDYINGVK
jgi:hypothetical protein